jgi:hypothetical protein
MIKQKKPAQIVVIGEGTRARVELDGLNISRMCSAVTVTHKANNASTASLTLHAGAVRIESRGAVCVDGSDLPESLELALLEYLQSKHGGRC